MKIFPAVHYSMGGLWVDYERTAAGGLVVGSPRNQQTNIPGLYAIGECDYQYHGANRLGANSLLSCIFSGLIVAPGHRRRCSRAPRGTAAEQPPSLFERRAQAASSRARRTCCKRPGGGENPYLIHQELGHVMTKAATVVRHNEHAATRPTTRSASWPSGPSAARCPTPATGPTRTSSSPRRCATCSRWPRRSSRARLQRDECRGAHFKPDFAMPGLEADRSGRAPPRGRSTGATASRRTRASGSRSTIATLRRRRRAAADATKTSTRR